VLGRCGRLTLGRLDRIASQTLKKDELTLDPKPLLRTVLHRFFGSVSGFAEMVVKHVPSPLDSAKTKIPVLYTGKRVWHVLCV